MANTVDYTAIHSVAAAPGEAKRTGKVEYTDGTVADVKYGAIDGRWYAQMDVAEALHPGKSIDTLYR